MRIVTWLRMVLAGCVLSLFGAPFAWAQGVGAQGVVGAPHPWEIGMQRSFGPIKDRVIDLHNLVLVLITIITLFVGGLLIWVMIRYNSKRNPVPTQTSHNTVLEIAWTVIPVLILVVMAIPSFRLIYYQDRTPDPDMTIKVTGHQWYWEYTYPDQGNVAIESRFVHDEDLKPGQLRLLDVDNQMVIPVNKKIRILTASTDVIHSFFIPAFGVQRYAIPGRTIETWMEADQIGTFYGECNQICGQDHSRMPISVRAVSEADFKTWVAEAKKSASAARLPKIASK
ncbi:MAG: cytochrome c oxidase subunit [Acetobacteraceae bacterium]|nr:cytochrome c oxidase subunit [Acetobacteraceae bacterium]